MTNGRRMNGSIRKLCDCCKCEIGAYQMYVSEAGRTVCTACSVPHLRPRKWVER